MKKRINTSKKLNKKSVIILSLIICLIIGIVVSMIVISNINKKLVKEIKSHYNKYVIVNKNTKLYSSNKKIVGSINKNFELSLESKKIENKNDTYFKIKDTDYYVYYKDIKKIEKIDTNKVNDNYLVWNYNYVNNNKNEFYEDNKKVLTVNKNINEKVLYSDDNYYYVKYLDKVLGVKKNDKKLVEHNNTTDKESSYISVIYYETIEDKCSNNNCVTLDNFNKQMEELKKNNYYFITLDDYKNYLKKNIRFKEKAVLLLTDKLDIIDTINKDEFRINKKSDDIKLSFVNKKSTVDSKLDSIEAYSIKNNTPIEDFSKMLNGEDVKEIPIVTQKSSSSSNGGGQGIAVINYHFFYDESIGESCGERICLELKNFKQQLDYLRDNGYKTLTMDEFTKWMYGEISLPEKSVLLTVDDGAKGTGKHNGNQLITTLEEYNMHATLFLITGWWSVENYRSKNLDIQSHTNDMHSTGNCGKAQMLCYSKDEMVSDLKRSLEIVDNNNSFCFPFYSYNETALEAVREAGFKIAFVGGNRKAKQSDNKYLIPRYPIYNTTSLDTFIKMVS